MNRAATILQATHDLGWCYTTPHDAERIIGLAREIEAEERRLYRAGGSGGGDGYADPTGNAAVDTTGNDSAEVTRTIDAAIALVAESVDELDREFCPVVGRRHTIPTSTVSRNGALAVSCTRLFRCKDELVIVEAAASGHADWMAHIDFLLTTRIADTAAWLYAKCAGIYDLSNVKHKAPALQRDRRVCEGCAADGRDAPVMGSSKRCARCIEFKREHKVEPTAAVRRWWDAHPRMETPPRLVADAKVAPKRARNKGRSAVA